MGLNGRRRSVAMISAAVAAVAALVTTFAMLFVSHHRPSDSALEPIGPPADSASSSDSSDPSGGSTETSGSSLTAMPGGLFGDIGSSTNRASNVAASAGVGAGAGTGALLQPPPPPQLPPLQVPPLQLPPPPNLGDWSALLQPVLDSQANAVAANIGGAITGAVGGISAATVNSAAVLLGDLILYDAYTNSGTASLAALPPAAALQAAGTALSQLPPPDFSGLTAAFAAAAAQPPMLDLPAQLPPLPQLPPPPTPEQVAALSSLPFLLPALPPLPQLPPPPGPEQVAALATLPFLLPALPPPPPIGLPLPPPIPLPSITRMIGLPF
jgi:hypothetical protein